MHSGSPESYATVSILANLSRDPSSKDRPSQLCREPVMTTFASLAEFAISHVSRLLREAEFYNYAKLLKTL